MKSSQKKQLGFTLVEMIVSLGLFSIVATVAVGALLVLIATNEQLQAEQSVMTNLSFAVDSMAREIRTGTHYYCAERPNYNAGHIDAVFSGNTHESLNLLIKDCPNGRSTGNALQGISFREGGDSITGSDERILYFSDTDNTSINYGKIMRRVGNGPAQSIVSSGIFIENAEFFVTGSTINDLIQPVVTIIIEARDNNSGAGKLYKIQTSVTQRTLDI